MLFRSLVVVHDVRRVVHGDDGLAIVSHIGELLRGRIRAVDEGDVTCAHLISLEHSMKTAGRTVRQVIIITVESPVVKER